MDQRIKKIREAERISHTKTYTKMPLYQSDGWLGKPIQTVLEILPLFKEYQDLRILDLGCGVGRNCLPFARVYDCEIDGIDILDLAIEKLNQNARNLQVQNKVHGIVRAIEDYPIEKEHYDLIIAVSALEHICSEEAFVKKLWEIKAGLRIGGIACLVINSGVQERNLKTGALMPAQFEVNLSKEHLQTILYDCFDGWKILKESVRQQRYQIPREHVFSDLTTEVVTWVARKEK